MSSGKRQHFIPATLIGQFSFQNKYSVPQIRNRLVYVKQKNSEDIKELRASSLLLKKKMYNLDFQIAGMRKNFIDNIWDSVEPNFPFMLKTLTKMYAKQEMPSELFIYFVEFCSQLIVRNPSFEENFFNRVQSVMNYQSLEESGYTTIKDNTNEARIMELQRLRPLLLYADITIFKASSSTKFINNDIGYINGEDDHPFKKRATISFPISPEFVITFYINTDKTAYNFLNLSQPKKFEHHRLTRPSVEDFNKSILFYSDQLVFSNRKQSLIEDFPKRPDDIKGYGLWLRYNPEKLNQLAIIHELDYLKLGYDGLIFHNISDTTF